jgi:hypothetical protein
MSTTATRRFAIVRIHPPRPNALRPNINSTQHHQPSRNHEPEHVQHDCPYVPIWAAYRGCSEAESDASCLFLKYVGWVEKERSYGRTTQGIQSTYLGQTDR